MSSPPRICVCGSSTKPLYGEHDLYRCVDCGSMLRASPISEAAASEMYSDAAYFDPLLKSLDVAGPMKSRWAFDLLSRFETQNDQRLADIGCGAGFLVNAARAMGLEAVGFDINEGSLAAATDRFGSNFHNMADFVGSGPYDFITMTDVLEHLPNPRLLLDDVRSELRDGGVLLVACPRADSVTARVFGRRWAQIKTEHEYYPSKRALLELLVSAGFVIESAASLRKRVNLGYLAAYSASYTVIHPQVDSYFRRLPSAVRHWDLHLPGGEQLVIARRVSA